MTFTWKGASLTPALTEIDIGDGLNSEQRRILAENFVSNASELTHPVAKLAYAHAAPVAYAMPANERHRPLLDMAKLDAAGISPLGKLRLVEESETIGVALAERDLDPGLRTVSDAEYQQALSRLKPFLRDK